VIVVAIGDGGERREREDGEGGDGTAKGRDEWSHGSFWRKLCGGSDRRDLPHEA